MFLIEKKRPKPLDAGHPNPIDLSIQPQRLIPRRLRKVSPRRSEDDAARSVDHHATTALIATREYGFLKIAALCSDAGNEDRHISNEIAYTVKFCREGRPHNEAAVFVLIPLRCYPTGDIRIEGIAVINDEVLKFVRPFIGRATQNDHAFIRAIQKRLQSLLSEIRMNGNSVAPEPVKRAHEVAEVRVVDVGALRIENHRNIRRDRIDVCNNLAKSVETVRSMRFKEGDVGLIAGDDVMCRINDPVGEGSERHLDAATSCYAERNFRELAIESDAQLLVRVCLSVETFIEGEIVHDASDWV